MNRELSERIATYVRKGIFNSQLEGVIRAFVKDYLAVVASSGGSSETSTALLLTLLDLAARQIEQPFSFSSIHHAIRSPFDYYTFGLDLIRPLIDFNQSVRMGWAHLDRLAQQLTAQENVVLLANHQIEPDPQVISLLLGDEYAHVAREIFFVAGDRVTTDPLAVPLSLGRNLICIYSRRHIDHPPEKKTEKLQHNRRAMQQLAELLRTGGQCIFVAPSGGRDRPDAHGKVAISPFDPSSIEMFYLLATHSPKPVHFYPLALATHSLVPPPQAVQQMIGEPRIIRHTNVGIVFGEELDLGEVQGHEKRELRLQRANAAWQHVCQLYTHIENLSKSE